MASEQIPDESELDVGAALGASEDTSIQQLILYIPNTDKAGNEIGDQDTWVEEATELLAAIGGGFTTLSPIDGGWVNEDGEVIRERVILTYTFVKPDQFLRELPSLRAFLHKMGRETNQGEVAFQFDNRFYRINEFDPLQGG